METPALQISTSRPPRLASERAKAGSTASASATSTRSTLASAGKLAAMAAAFFWLRHQMETLAPSARNRWAMAAPIPVEPPVTITRLLVRSVILPAPGCCPVDAKMPHAMSNDEASRQRLELVQHLRATAGLQGDNDSG